MLDLFDSPILPGLVVSDEFVTETDEQNLIAAINAVDLMPFRFQGWLGKRETLSFGWHYDFDNGGFARTDPIPPWLIPLRDRAEQFANIEPGSLIQALVIRYDVGAGIGWHRDRPHFDQIVGISLGHLATMRFRRRVGSGFERRSAALAARGAYHLQGEARRHWEHSIAPMSEPRWSITFRSLSDTGRRLSGSRGG